MLTAVGIPIIDSIPGEAFQSHVQAIIEVVRRLDFQVPWNKEGSPTSNLTIINAFNMFPHDRARSYITNLALNQGCDVLFFIDADMIIPPDAFPRMLKTMIDGNAAVVSGWYYRRGWDYSPVWANEAPDGNGYMRPFAPSGVHRIDSSGLGCALIDLHWLKDNLEAPYYTMGVGTMGTEIHDDVSFFKKVKEKGGLVLGDADVRCGHLGQRQVICDRTWQIFRKIETEIGLHKEETSPKLETNL